MTGSGDRVSLIGSTVNLEDSAGSEESAINVVDDPHDRRHLNEIVHSTDTLTTGTRIGYTSGFACMTVDSGIRFRCADRRG